MVNATDNGSLTASNHSSEPTEGLPKDKSTGTGAPEAAKSAPAAAALQNGVKTDPAGAGEATEGVSAPRGGPVSTAATEKDLFVAKEAQGGSAATKKPSKETEAQKELFLGSTGIDLAFLVDATYSMSSYIRAVGEQCIAIAEDVAAAHCADSVLRVAFVAYRDLNGEATNIESLDFTTDIAAFKKYVKALRVAGGVDLAEDVFGGLERAGELTWSQGPGNARCLFHLADAPCHGVQYHDLGSHRSYDRFPEAYDRFPEGDFGQRDLRTLLRQLKEVVGVDEYTFTHITNDTQKMLTEFKKVYEGDEWINEDHFRTARSHWHSYDDDFDDGPQPIEDEMFRSVRSSVQRSVHHSFRSGSNSMRHLAPGPVSAPAAPRARTGVGLSAPGAPARPIGHYDLTSSATVRRGTAPAPSAPDDKLDWSNWRARLQLLAEQEAGLVAPARGRGETLDLAATVRGETVRAGNDGGVGAGESAPPDISRDFNFSSASTVKAETVPDNGGSNSDTTQEAAKVEAAAE